METLQVVDAIASIMASLLIGAFLIILFVAMLQEMSKKKVIRKRRPSKKPAQWIEKHSKIAKTRKRDWHGRFIKTK